VFALAARDFALTLWGVFVLYALSAPIYLVLRRMRRVKSA